LFWIYAAALAVIAALFVLLPLWNFHRRGVQQLAQRENANLLIFQERIAELEAELANGTLEEENFHELKRELQRSLLSDVSAAKVKVVATAAEKPQFFTRARVIPLAMVALIVPTSIGLYLQWGYQDELELATLFERTEQVSEDPQEIRDLIFSIGALIERDNENGWAVYLLAQNLANIGMFAEAATALERASALIEQPQDKVSVLGQYAFLEFMLAEQVVTEKVQGIIDQAQLIDPNQFLILQVQGLDAERRQDHQAAITYWRRILQQTPPGPESDQIQARIEIAQQALAGAAPQSAEPPVPTGAQVQVQVSLAEGLSLPAGTRVFVSALDVNGRGQPLAARVLSVEDLPVTLTLSDADAVGPFNISSAQTLYVVATASSSGTANVQSGDYQARSEGFARTVDAALIPLVIADRVP
jgi:cytochrome c-type biogenesis protein CcmH